MTHTTMILAALAAGFALITAHAFAQEPGSIGMVTPVKREYGWSNVAELNVGEKIEVVLKSTPAHRIGCRIAFAAVASLGCSQRFGKKTIVFDQKDLRAVVKPRYADPPVLESFAVLGAGGGALIGAVFLARVSAVALIGAIPIGFVGGVLLLGSIYLFAAAEHHPEALVYSADGAKLADLK